jgi:hypothetical protein
VWSFLHVISVTVMQQILVLDPFLNINSIIFGTKIKERGKFTPFLGEIAPY